MKAFPKISIVTPTFNQGEFIEETIVSVLEQGYPELEYIIIDGGSTDNTIEIIKKYEKHLKYWVSEKDKGQAHAINKGLSHCTGEIFNWLNSDDYLEKNALKRIASGFSDGADMVAGRVREFRGNDTIRITTHQNLSAKGLLYWLPGVAFVQPGVWMRRSLVEQCGRLTEEYQCSFDWELYIKYLSRFPRVSYLDDVLVHFRYHDGSKTVNLQEQFQQERLKIIESFLNSTDMNLQKMASRYQEDRRLHERMRQVLNSDNSRMEKSLKVLREFGFGNFRNLRVIGGALRQIISG